MNLTDQSRAEIMAYNASVTTRHEVYRLTWPAALHGVCVIGGQWRRLANGEIEAAYLAGDLEFCNLVMEQTT